MQTSGLRTRVRHLLELLSRAPFLRASGEASGNNARHANACRHLAFDGTAAGPRGFPQEQTTHTKTGCCSKGFR